MEIEIKMSPTTVIFSECHLPLASLPPCPPPTKKESAEQCAKSAKKSITNCVSMTTFEFFNKNIPLPSPYLLSKTSSLVG